MGRFKDLIKDEIARGAAPSIATSAVVADLLEEEKSMGIYKQLKEAGVPLDNHESDLYAKVTPESKRIVDEAKEEGLSSVTVFKSDTDGALWYDIPFAYEPWWEARK